MCDHWCNSLWYIQWRNAHNSKVLILVIWIMLLPGITALISHYRGSFTQVIPIIHSDYWLTLRAHTHAHTVISCSPKSKQFSSVVFLAIYPNHFKESFSLNSKNALPHFSHYIFDECSCYLHAHMSHANCLTIMPTAFSCSQIFSFCFDCWLSDMPQRHVRGSHEKSWFL